MFIFNFGHFNRSSMKCGNLFIIIQLDPIYVSIAFIGPSDDNIRIIFNSNCYWNIVIVIARGAVFTPSKLRRSLSSG